MGLRWHTRARRCLRRCPSRASSLTCRSLRWIRGRTRSGSARGGRRRWSLISRRRTWWRAASSFRSTRSLVVMGTSTRVTRTTIHRCVHACIRAFPQRSSVAPRCRCAVLLLLLRVFGAWRPCRGGGVWRWRRRCTHGCVCISLHRSRPSPPPCCTVPCRAAPSLCSPPLSRSLSHSLPSPPFLHSTH